MRNLTQEINKLLIRKTNANKNDCGHVLIIGGDNGMGGAVIMAAEAAYRAGAGKVTVLTKEETFSALLSRLPNAMTIPTSLQKSEKILENKNVIVIGPGLGKSKWAKNLLGIALSSNLPKVIDADALNILSSQKKKFDLSNSIITPHAGEAARLLDVLASEIQKNRHSFVKKLHQKFGAVSILKGKNTLVCSSSQKIYECPYGNEGMATAGMGDILSGIIGALLAQKLTLQKAAVHGVNIHALAGDLVAEKQGKIGMMPTDLFPFIPLIINQHYISDLTKS